MPKSKKVQDALKATRELPPQTSVELMHGLKVRRTSGGVPVVRLHYSAHPERDPETHLEWKQTERRLYTSQASWDREQEIRDEAGGGELVYADTLVTHWNKIVITNPEWRPHPGWHLEAGFDHGRTNPTVLLRAAVDGDGVIYFCGEYYMPGLEIADHVTNLRKMENIDRIEVCFADRSMFDAENNQQSAPRPGEAQQRAKSYNELYVERGFELLSPFAGDRSDVSFAGRLMMHWSNLDKREPSVKIFCPNYSERPQPGLYNWGCPNLLWELMRIRRVKLTAQQLLSRNVSEAIVDKDNHAVDAAKYLLMSHPEPTLKSRQEIIAEAVKPLAEAHDMTSANVRGLLMRDEPQQIRPARLGRRR